MPPYRLEVKPSVYRVLGRIPEADLGRIDSRVRSLADEPRPPGCQKLAGEEDLYRVRQGDWRIVYRVLDRERLVLVLVVGHRRDVYR
jgi:mRNA interferase RelE/StbE